MNKSNAFYVGSSKGNVSQPFSVNGLSWPQNLVKYLGLKYNQIMYKFIWASKREKIGRPQLSCEVKEGGKMIDINQYVLSLRFNFIFKLFDNNYQSSWKSLENRFIDENVLFCILRSNVKLNSMLVGRVAFLRFTLTILRTLKPFTDVDNDSKCLWFNIAVKYRNQLMFVEEFCKAGIFNFF